ncbi:MAG: GTP-binding protein [Planctomycetales bacterium]|nr:GTP-binding protein [Planctomycetales bacterium]
MNKATQVGAPSGINDPRYTEALKSVDHALEQFKGCSEEERRRLREDLAQLRDMAEKLSSGRVEIVVFGEISTGKSALINALVGQEVTSVDVQGGWTKEAWHVDWQGSGYIVHGLSNSSVVLIDTPGINEVGGNEREILARDIADRADLILFVTDSDLTETEHQALTQLVDANKPVIVVLNKIDLYAPEQRERLLQVLNEERLVDLVAPENVVTASADPRQVEYIIESADGSTRSEWRKPAPKVDEVKARILEILERDGTALLALNAAMYAADKTDRIANLRVRMRDAKANQMIWSFAGAKALAVALNPVGFADLLGGSAVDASMVVTLAHIYGLEMTWANARGLIKSIAQAAGWMFATELSTNAAAAAFKVATLGWGTVLTAVPQGAAAGYGSYIVGRAAKYYFEHGASWGAEAPKSVVRRILDDTDKESVIAQLRDEIQRKMSRNKYAD